jgi:hypothetical protein
MRREKSKGRTRRRSRTGVERIYIGGTEDWVEQQEGKTMEEQEKKNKIRKSRKEEKWKIRRRRRAEGGREGIRRR